MVAQPSSMCGSREGTGGPDPPPPGKHKIIGLLSNSGPDPLKIAKLLSQHSMLGHHQHASEKPFIMAFHWRADDGPLKMLF